MDFGNFFDREEINAYFFNSEGLLLVLVHRVIFSSHLNNN